MESEQEKEVASVVPVQQVPVKLIDVPITSENVALNLLISFNQLAHKRGAFSLEESAKIWECVKKFNSPN
jgi:hypothetical protein